MSTPNPSDEDDVPIIIIIRKNAAAAAVKLKAWVKTPKAWLIIGATVLIGCAIFGK